MTKAQKQILRSWVLRCWPSKFSSVNLLSGDDFEPKYKGWTSTASGCRKVLDEMLSEGLIEVVQNGSPTTHEGGECNQNYTLFQPAQ